MQNSRDESGLKSTQPNLAVFWFDEESPRKFRLYNQLNEAGDDVVVTIKEGVIQENCTMNPVMHEEIWHEIQVQNLKWTNKRYETVARGRVSWDSSTEGNCFIVYLPLAYLNNTELHQEIVKKYHLPTNNIRFETNDHYRIRKLNDH